ncbi:NAD(P)H-binding protein [Tsukamurella sp. 8F]|uniref:NAD(P)H-binding protein n=1 Tax=Tsukamurella sp. 8F TaxID=3031961 RepID=UPI0023B8B46D|nr:NAD(P)H-binding protein [Tsukamurella sp. 8F]MDF0586096.1 NAD(P)H-binding protein [Tsukamurella sp. 8F]
MPDPIETEVPSRPSILVTGATGTLGQEVVHRLVRRGVPVRGLSRAQPERRPGVEWTVGDLTDPVDMSRALAGVDAVFLVWPLLDPAPAREVVKVLSGADRRVVYVSSTAIDDNAARQSDPIVQTHADMEAMLSQAGLRPVVLRSDTLAANARGWSAQLRDGDDVYGPDIARTAVVDERDVADAAEAVLLAPPDRLDRGPHLLTGPELITRAEQVHRLGAALGRPLRFHPSTANATKQRMLADGRPEPLVQALITASTHRPDSDLVTDHLERLTGHPAGTFAQWAADHAAEFTPPNTDRGTDQPKNAAASS